MPILGAHMSIVGGYDQAVTRARDVGCQCVQLFTKNNSQWRGRPITDEEAATFAARLRECRVTHPLAHASYLINLASPDPSVWNRSVDGLVAELGRAEKLGIPFVVVHPGAYTTSDARSGLRRIIQAVDEIHRQTRGWRSQCLLETTAGQGTSLGWRFENLAEVLQGVKCPERVGVCFDTCHVFAAGYELRGARAYRNVLREFDRLVGLACVRAIHLNDSRHELGSRVDRHAHIGRGRMGFEPFRLLLNDGRFDATPMYLETPKGKSRGRDWDRVNLGTLRSLLIGGDARQAGR